MLKMFNPHKVTMFARPLRRLVFSTMVCSERIHLRKLSSHVTSTTNLVATTLVINNTRTRKSAIGKSIVTMGRKLPWKRAEQSPDLPAIKTGAPSSALKRKSPGSLSTPSRPKRVAQTPQSTLLNRTRSPTTSPPPEPPKEEYVASHFTTLPCPGRARD